MILPVHFHCRLNRLGCRRVRYWTSTRVRRLEVPLDRHRVARYLPECSNETDQVFF